MEWVAFAFIGLVLGVLLWDTSRNNRSLLRDLERSSRLQVEETLAHLRKLQEPEEVEGIYWVVRIEPTPGGPHAKCFWTFEDATKVGNFLWGMSLSAHRVYKRGELVPLGDEAEVSAIIDCLESWEAQ